MAAKFCSQCGTPRPAEGDFCPVCGASLSGGAAPTPTDQPSTPPSAPPEPPAPPHSAPPPSAPRPAGPPAPPRPGPPPPLDSGDNGKRRLGGLIAIGAAALLALTVAVVGALVLIDRNSDEPKAGDDSSAVILEPVALEVPDPFTASVAVNESALPSNPDDTGQPLPEESPEASPQTPAGAGGVVMTASSPGLYGGTQDQQACDPEALVAFLEADADKAAAWAGVQGIEVEEIRDFVASLTPVLLRRDTRVVNYGYNNGKANSYPAVLQAGSAVMVDEYGVPRAKCSCGNPLTEAQPVTTSTRYTGARWPGFDPSIVVVVKATVKVTVIILVDITTDRPFSRPVGTTGAADTDAPDGDGAGDGGTTPSEGTDADILAEIGSIAGVSNGPTQPSVVTLPAARITALRTYHWNNAQGVTPGTISLRSADGTTYGPFSTTGLDGQGGVPNAYWVAVTNISVPAGSYTVIDSDPSTWAWAPDTGGRGMLTIWGVRESATEQSSANRGPEARTAVTSLFCAEVDQYVSRVTARETSPNQYRVNVIVALDSGSWTARYDVDLSQPSGPKVSATDSDAGGLLC